MAKAVAVAVVREIFHPLAKKQSVHTMCTLILLRPGSSRSEVR